MEKHNGNGKTEQNMTQSWQRVSTKGKSHQEEPGGSHQVEGPQKTKKEVQVSSYEQWKDSEGVKSVSNDPISDVWSIHLSWAGAEGLSWTRRRALGDFRWDG